MFMKACANFFQRRHDDIAQYRLDCYRHKLLIMPLFADVLHDREAHQIPIVKCTIWFDLKPIRFPGRINIQRNPCARSMTSDFRVWISSSSNIGTLYSSCCSALSSNTIPEGLSRWGYPCDQAIASLITHGAVAHGGVG